MTGGFGTSLPLGSLTFTYLVEIYLLLSVEELREALVFFSCIVGDCVVWIEMEWNWMR